MKAELVPREPSENEVQREQLLGVLIGAVIIDKDVDFAVEIVAGQKVIPPSEMLDYLDEMRKSSKEPEDRDMWNELFNNYLDIVVKQKQSNEEGLAINKLLRSLRQDERLTIGQAEAAAKIDELSPEERFAERQVNSHVNDWERDLFFVDVENSQKGLFRTYSEYAEAEEVALSPTDDITKLQHALDLIAQVADVQVRNRMFRAFDEYIYNWAEALFCGRGQRHIQPGVALHLINKFMSSDESIQRARGALDKYVFQLAEQLIADEPEMVEPDFGGSPNANPAKRVILEYGSTPGRREAMLFRLGLI